MAWTAPRTWTDGEVVTAVMMNAHVRDNTNALHDYMLGAQDLGANWQISGERALYLESSAVAHGMTTIVATDVYAQLLIGAAGAGGIMLRGLTESGTDTAVILSGYTGTAAPTLGVIAFDAYKKSGTTGAALAAGEFIANFRNAGTTKLTIGGDGRVTITGTASGTSALTLSAGDLTLNSGNITASAGTLTIASTSSLGAAVTVLSGGVFINTPGVSYVALNNGGGVFGFNGTPGSGVVAIGDAAMNLTNNGNVVFNVDTNDYSAYLRSTNEFQWVIGSAQKALLGGTNFTISTHCIPGADNTYNLGVSGTTRWKDIFAVTKTSVLDVSWGSGRTLISVLEGPEYKVYDSGTVTLSVSGRATVSIDPRVAEISHLAMGYQVTTSGARVANKSEASFELIGAPSDVVDWMLMATRAGFENVRWRDPSTEAREPLGLHDPEDVRNRKHKENNTDKEPADARRVILRSPVAAAVAAELVK